MSTLPVHVIELFKEGEKNKKQKKTHGSQHKRVILRVKFSIFFVLLVNNNNMLLVNFSILTVFLLGKEQFYNIESIVLEMF